VKFTIHSDSYPTYIWCELSRKEEPFGALSQHNEHPVRVPSLKLVGEETTGMLSDGYISFSLVEKSWRAPASEEPLGSCLVDGKGRF
jgi:hypothetical protein